MSHSDHWGPTQWAKGLLTTKAKIQEDASTGRSNVGRHVVATDRIEPGTRIAGEPPGFIVPKCPSPPAADNDANRVVPDHTINWLYEQDTLQPGFLETVRGHLCSPPVDSLIFQKELAEVRRLLGADLPLEKAHLITGCALAVQCNAHAARGLGFGSRVVFPTLSKFNHSCDANCLFFTEAAQVDSPWPIAGAIVAQRRIRPGEQLTLNYLPPLYADSSVHQRRGFLLKHKYFLCQCDRCTKESENEGVEFSDAVKTYEAEVLQRCLAGDLRGLDTLVQTSRSSQALSSLFAQPTPYWTIFRWLVSRLEGHSAAEWQHMVSGEGNDPTAVIQGTPALQGLMEVDRLAHKQGYGMLAISGALFGVTQSFLEFASGEGSALGEREAAVRDGLRQLLALHLLLATALYGVPLLKTPAEDLFTQFGSLSTLKGPSGAEENLQLQNDGELVCHLLNLLSKLLTVAPTLADLVAHVVVLLRYSHAPGLPNVWKDPLLNLHLFDLTWEMISPAPSASSVGTRTQDQNYSSHVSTASRVELRVMLEEKVLDVLHSALENPSVSKQLQSVAGQSPVPRIEQALEFVFPASPQKEVTDRAGGNTSPDGLKRKVKQRLMDWPLFETTLRKILKRI